MAFVGPTSLALSFMASGLKLRRSDNILIYFEDYPSNVYPWMALAEQGVEVRLMNTRGLGVIRPKDVMGQVDENTRLVALASCHFISGYRVDFQAIGKQLRERNILFCLDAIQTLGAFPTTVEHVDLLAADAHKWLLGPCGAGIMYVRGSVQASVNPPIHGWHNVRCPNFVAQEQIVFRARSQKYEAGTHNLLGIVGLVTAMGLLVELGVENIARELLRKRALLVPALQAKGCTVLQADAPPEAAQRHRLFHAARGRPGSAASEAPGRGGSDVVARRPGRAEVHPPVAPLLQHGRGAGASVGAGYLALCDRWMCSRSGRNSPSSGKMAAKASSRSKDCGGLARAPDAKARWM